MTAAFMWPATLVAALTIGCARPVVESEAHPITVDVVTNDYGLYLRMTDGGDPARVLEGFRLRCEWMAQSGSIACDQLPAQCDADSVVTALPSTTPQG